MASYNRVVIMGNLTRDPEQKYTPGGTAFCNIDVAVNERRKDQQGNWIEEVTFVAVTLWARTSEVACQYLRKGSSVLIEGKLKQDRWEKDGKKHSVLKVVGEKLQMLGGKSSDQQRESAQAQADPWINEASTGGDDFASDDIPF